MAEQQERRAGGSTHGPQRDVRVENVKKRCEELRSLAVFYCTGRLEEEVLVWEEREKTG